MKRSVAIRTTPEARRALRAIAEQHGLFVRRSARAGDGDISALVEAIAEGTLVVVRPVGSSVGSTRSETTVHDATRMDVRLENSAS